MLNVELEIKLKFKTQHSKLNTQNSKLIIQN